MVLYWVVQMALCFSGLPGDLQRLSEGFLGIFKKKLKHRDGKGWALGKVYMEWFWGAIKYDEVCLTGCNAERPSIDWGLDAGYVLWYIGLVLNTWGNIEKQVAEFLAFWL